MFRFFYYLFLRYFMIGEFRRLLPKNRWGDNLFALCQFVRSQNRFPSDAMRFNDVLYRLKISDDIESDLRVRTSDKEFVKDYISSVVGDDYNIKTLGILRSDSDLRNFIFPSRCVIKPTHSSGRVILKQADDIVDLDLLSSWLSDDIKPSRERNYRSLEPKLIVEELVFDSVSPTDIKFHCFCGKVKIIQFDYDRTTLHRRKFYDRNMTDLRFSTKVPLYEGDFIPPACLSDMIVIADKLSSSFSTVRIDMYAEDTKFYIGEITHLHGSSTELFYTDGIESVSSAESRINRVLFD